MAAVQIDGTTYKGYWKLTVTTGEPDVFTLIPKAKEIRITTVTETEGSLVCGNFDYEFDADTTGGNGEVLDTAVKIAQYLSDYR